MHNKMPAAPPFMALSKFIQKFYLKKRQQLADQIHMFPSDVSQATVFIVILSNINF